MLIESKNRWKQTRLLRSVNLVRVKEGPQSNAGGWDVWESISQGRAVVHGAGGRGEVTPKAWTVASTAVSRAAVLRSRSHRYRLPTTSSASCCIASSTSATSPSAAAAAVKRSTSFAWAAENSREREGLIDRSLPVGRVD